MVEVRLGILNEHVQHLFAICQQISLNSLFRENDRLSSRNPYVNIQMFQILAAVSIMSVDTSMSAVTREIQEEEEKSMSVEEKLKQDLKKYKVRSTNSTHKNLYCIHL